MKYYAILAVTTLFAQAALAQQYPLGHHVHDFQRKNSREQSQGWDPPFFDKDTNSKPRMTASISTFPVGLPGNMEPDDLGSAGCPSQNTISDPSHVSGLKTLSLTGVSETVYLIENCDKRGAILKVKNGMKVAIWGSAFRQISGQSGDSGFVWVVDSLVDADPGDNAGISCLGAECVVMYSEILGGDDIMKMNPNNVCYKSHLHGYDRAPNSGEHNDGIQINPGADFTVINCNVEGPFRNSNSPLFAGVAGKIHNWRVKDTLASGGTNAWKMGSKSGTDWSNAVLLNSRLMGDATGVSWTVDAVGSNEPCVLGGGSSEFTGDGNTASNGDTSGVDHMGRSWDFGACNQGTVSQANRDFFAAKEAELETWTSEIRAAAGAPPSAGATISVATTPKPAYTATDVTLSAVVSDCSPELYEFECGDGGTFDDGSSPSNSTSCGTMAPGSYDASVRASGGTCEESLSGTTRLTVSPPPAPVLH